jgi:hypothetical protein
MVSLEAVTRGDGKEASLLDPGLLWWRTQSLSMNLAKRCTWVNLNKELGVGKWGWVCQGTWALPVPESPSHRARWGEVLRGISWPQGTSGRQWRETCCVPGTCHEKSKQAKCRLRLSVGNTAPHPAVCLLSGLVSYISSHLIRFTILTVICRFSSSAYVPTKIILFSSLRPCSRNHLS